MIHTLPQIPLETIIATTALPPQTEAKLQSICYQWAYNTYPQIRGLLFSVPNGGTRNMREAQVLKATGLTAGVPDMLLLHPIVTAFEFKSITGRLSPVQINIHAKWAEKGITVHIVNNEEIFKEILNKLFAV